MWGGSGCCVQVGLEEWRGEGGGIVGQQRRPRCAVRALRDGARAIGGQQRQTQIQIQRSAGGVVQSRDLESEISSRNRFRSSQGKL